jgi:hypothetical protein
MTAECAHLIFSFIVWFSTSEDGGIVVRFIAIFYRKSTRLEVELRTSSGHFCGFLFADFSAGDSAVPDSPGSAVISTFISSISSVSVSISAISSVSIISVSVFSVAVFPLALFIGLRAHSQSLPQATIQVQKYVHAIFIGNVNYSFTGESAFTVGLELDFIDLASLGIEEVVQIPFGAGVLDTRNKSTKSRRQVWLAPLLMERSGIGWLDWTGLNLLNDLSLVF